MTILSNSHDFVFVHLHKCGGSSVEIAYQPHAKWNDIVLGSTDTGERLQHIYRKLHGLHKHSTAAEIQDVVGPFWNEAWTFSLIRHPVSIMESFYRWIHKLIDNFAQTSEQPFDVVLDKIRNKVVDRPFMQYEVTQPFANAEDFNDFVMRFSKKSTLGTIFDRLSRDGELIVDEVFGPVVSVQRYRDIDEAITRANGTPYGLQAGIFTRSVDRALGWARRLQFGGVTINETPTFRADQQPYGGINESGNTREGPRYAVESMTERRLVIIDGL